MGKLARAESPRVTINELLRFPRDSIIHMFSKNENIASLLFIGVVMLTDHVLPVC